NCGVVDGRRFDRALEPRLQQFLDVCGGGGAAFPTRRGLARNSDQHGGTCSGKRWGGFYLGERHRERSSASNRPWTASASAAAGSAPARSTVWSLSARPCEMRSPKPPAPMK